MRVVGKPPRVIHRSGRLPQREGIRLGVEVAEIRVVERRRAVLLIAGVRRDEEEGAIVEGVGVPGRGPPAR